MNVKRLTAPALSFFLLAGSSAFAQNYYQGYQGPPPGYQDRGYQDRGYQDRGDWQQPPNDFSDARRRGFQDGIEGARHDFDNHRRPNVNNRDEFRHPNIDASLRRDYRDGFRRGYQVGVQHIYNGGRDHDHDHDNH